jgi:pimeloyl-ACP methyl ester carboxylesterase
LKVSPRAATEYCSRGPAGKNDEQGKVPLLNFSIMPYNVSMRAGIDERYIKVGDIRVRYLAAGESGPPLVLVHGLGASAEIWKENILPLAGNYRVHAPDLIGFGHTDKPDINYSPFDFLVFLDGFISALGLQKTSLAGLSLGGGIVLLYTLEYPGKVDKLVLVDSAGLGKEMTVPLRLGSVPFLSRWFKVSKPVMGSLMKRLVHDPGVITDSLVDFYYELLVQPHAMRTVSRVLSSVANLAGAKKDVLVYIRDRLSEISSPTLIVWGREDRIIPLKHGIYGHGQIRGSRLEVFEQCGHIPNLEKPAEFNRLVRDFLGVGSGEQP